MNEELNAYEELVQQTAAGRIVACIPIEINGKPCVFISASDPNGAPDEAWANDPTDYSGLSDGQNFFGHEGIGLAYAVAMIRYSRALAEENGLNPVA